MITARPGQLRQRAEYTHKHNLKFGRHGWLRLTPAYSVKIVEDLIGQCEQAVRVLDPFCGTATTALSAASHGHEAVMTDINPFLVWRGQVKTAHYSARMIAATRDASSCTLRIIETIAPKQAPALHNIKRWWAPSALLFLRRLKAAIEKTTRERSAPRNLLLMAFCRTAISLSNAAFNHQSMSFKDDSQLAFDYPMDLGGVFREDVEFVLRGAEDNPRGAATVVLGDSRELRKAVECRFERVITSPPYANRMSYIRELRPYMYWLGYLTNGRDAGELDWLAIGGTWGVATSRLSEWQTTKSRFEHVMLSESLDRIAHKENKNGPLLANYIAKYFDDMWAHFKALTKCLAPNAELHYIVGNSTFYGTLLPTERIYAAMLEALEFSDIECRPIRKRNSKKDLIEFDVVARWTR